MRTRRRLGGTAAAVWLWVSIAAPASATILNGSFEADLQGQGSFCITYAAPLCSSVTAWSGAFYLVRGQHPFLSSPEPYPDGLQVAMLQNTGTLRQSVTLAAPGTYELTWFDAGRAGFGGDQDYEVSVDGSVLGSFSTTTGSPWQQRSLVFAANAGTFTLEIAGQKPFSAGDGSALLDHFVLTPFAAPEPSLVALGAAALAAGASRRRLGAR